MTTAAEGYRLGMLGRKVGMMRVFTDDGDAVPVTVLDVSNNRVTQVKTEQTDGYNALQVAFGARKASRVTKPEAGHLAKAGVEAGEILQEFRVPADVVAQYAPGAKVPVTLFAAGQKVDVQGTSIGKGFTGTIKRHNFSSQRASHGNSRSHNVPGSISMAQDPGRVFPGKRWPAPAWPTTWPWAAPPKSRPCAAKSCAWPGCRGAMHRSTPTWWRASKPSPADQRSPERNRSPPLAGG